VTGLDAPERVSAEPGSTGRAAASASRNARTGLSRYRRRRLLALGLLVVLLLAAAVVGGRSVLLHAARFRVSQIAVTGATQVDPSLIRAASGIQLGGPLLAVRADEVRQRLTAIPLLATVEVARDWPGTVQLTVTERTPVALASSATGPALVDSTGLPYQLAPKPAPRLPRLAADRVAPDDPATEAGLAVLAALSPEVRDKLQVVEADGPGEVTLRLAGGKQVRWGSPDASARKAAVLAVLLTQPGTVYDVTAPDLPTIRR
jgi:cell division protein FtsQ